MVHPVVLVPHKKMAYSATLPSCLAVRSFAASNNDRELLVGAWRVAREGRGRRRRRRRGRGGDRYSLRRRGQLRQLQRRRRRRRSNGSAAVKERAEPLGEEDKDVDAKSVVGAAFSLFCLPHHSLTKRESRYTGYHHTSLDRTKEIALIPVDLHLFPRNAVELVETS